MKGYVYSLGGFHLPGTRANLKGRLEAGGTQTVSGAYIFGIKLTRDKSFATIIYADGFGFAMNGQNISHHSEAATVRDRYWDMGSREQSNRKIKWAQANQGGTAGKYLVPVKLFHGWRFFYAERTGDEIIPPESFRRKQHEISGNDPGSPVLLV